MCVCVCVWSNQKVWDWLILNSVVNTNYYNVLNCLHCLYQAMLGRKMCRVWSSHHTTELTMAYDQNSLSSTTTRFPRFRPLRFFPLYKKQFSLERKGISRRQGNPSECDELAVKLFEKRTSRNVFINGNEAGWSVWF